MQHPHCFVSNFARHPYQHKYLGDVLSVEGYFAGDSHRVSRLVRHVTRMLT